MSSERACRSAMREMLSLRSLMADCISRICRSQMAIGHEQLAPFSRLRIGDRAQWEMSHRKRPRAASCWNTLSSNLGQQCGLSKKKESTYIRKELLFVILGASDGGRARRHACLAHIKLGLLWLRLIARAVGTSLASIRVLLSSGISRRLRSRGSPDTNVLGVRTNASWQRHLAAARTYCLMG